MPQPWRDSISRMPLRWLPAKNSCFGVSVTAGGMSDGGIGAREVLTGTWRETNSATNSADVNSIRSQLSAREAAFGERADVVEVQAGKCAAHFPKGTACQSPPVSMLSLTGPERVAHMKNDGAAIDCSRGIVSFTSVHAPLSPTYAPIVGRACRTRAASSAPNECPTMAVAVTSGSTQFSCSQLLLTQSRALTQPRPRAFPLAATARPASASRRHIHCARAPSRGSASA